MGNNVPNDHKIYQLYQIAINIPNGHKENQHLISKTLQNIAKKYFWIFGMKNMSSGNPGTNSAPPYFPCSKN
jgi:hypothetical protein